MTALEEMPGLHDYLFNLVRSPEALAAQKQKEAPLNPGDRMISIIVNPAAITAAPPTYSMRELRLRPLLSTGGFATVVPSKNYSNAGTAAGSNNFCFLR